MYWLSIIEFKIFTFFHQPIIEVPPNTLLFPGLIKYGTSCPLVPLQLRCSCCPFDLQSLPSVSSVLCELRLQSTCLACIFSIRKFLHFLLPFRLLLPSSYSRLLMDRVEWDEVRLRRIQLPGLKFRMVGSHLLVFFLGWVQRIRGREWGHPWVHSTWCSNPELIFWFFVPRFWNQGLSQNRQLQCDCRRLEFCYRRFNPWVLRIIFFRLRWQHHFWLWCRGMFSLWRQLPVRFQFEVVFLD